MRFIGSAERTLLNPESISPQIERHIDRITTIWRECLAAYQGPYLFGKLSMADAMHAPVVTRFLTYDVKLDPLCEGYCKTIMALPDMIA